MAAVWPFLAGQFDRETLSDIPRVQVRYRMMAQSQGDKGEASGCEQAGAAPDGKGDHRRNSDGIGHRRRRKANHATKDHHNQSHHKPHN